MDLIIIAVLALLLVPLVLFTTGALRIILGLALVLFFPGYALAAALFPRKRDIDTIERLTLSLALSIAVVPLLGVIMNFTPWGFRPHPILVSLVLFIALMTLIAGYRRRKLPPEVRFGFQLRPPLYQLFGWWALQKSRYQVVIVLLLVAIVGAAGIVVYNIVVPQEGEIYSEFYILGAGGKAENYPQELVLGSEGKVILGIVNREHQTTVYKVAIVFDGETIKEYAGITLNHGDKWQQEVSFVPVKAGPKQKFEFRLYKGAGVEPYRLLSLWIDIKPKP